MLSVAVITDQVIDGIVLHFKFSSERSLRFVGDGNYLLGSSLACLDTKSDTSNILLVSYPIASKSNIHYVLTCSRCFFFEYSNTVVSKIQKVGAVSGFD
jgi:hypothetical protein